MFSYELLIIHALNHARMDEIVRHVEICVRDKRGGKILISGFARFDRDKESMAWTEILVVPSCNVATKR